MADNIAKGNTGDIGITDENTTSGRLTDSMRANPDSFSGDWTRDRNWWESNYMNRPYAAADRRFENYEPGYRFAYQSMSRYKGKKWDQVEPSMRSDWNHFEGRGESAWENVKDAVRDAWDSITGKL